MKILLVSFFFPPYSTIGAVRTGKLARFLLDHNHAYSNRHPHSDLYLHPRAADGHPHQHLYTPAAHSNPDCHQYVYSAAPNCHTDKHPHPHHCAAA